MFLFQVIPQGTFTPSDSCLRRAYTLVAPDALKRAGEHEVKRPLFEPYYFRFGSRAVSDREELSDRNQSEAAGRSRF